MNETKTTIQNPLLEEPKNCGQVSASTDVLDQFEVMRNQLRKEKADLIARVGRIEELLGEAAVANGAPVDSQGRIKNPMTLRQAVMQVTKGKQLTKKEIYAAVQKLGYRFGSKNPWNNLYVILYGKKSKPQLKKIGDKFISS